MRAAVSLLDISVKCLRFQLVAKKRISTRTQLVHIYFVYMLFKKKSLPLVSGNEPSFNTRSPASKKGKRAAGSRV